MRCAVRFYKSPACMPLTKVWPGFYGSIRGRAPCLGFPWRCSRINCVTAQTGLGKGSSIMTRIAGAWSVFLLVTVGVVLVPGAKPSHAALAKQEFKCASKLGKSAVKVAKIYAKEVSKCRNADISGKTPGSCPNAANLSKIDKIKAKAETIAAKLCKSTCSRSSTIECISNRLCPPLPSGAGEKCSGGAKGITFDMSHLGFPGAHCEAALGGPLTEPPDLGRCTAEVAGQAAAALIDNVYGALGTSSVSADAAKCLAGIAKMAVKLTDTTAKMIAKCHNNILSGKTQGDPTQCAVDDAKAAAKIAKMEGKLRDAVAKCTDAQISELDICGGGVTTVTEAQDCLVQAAREAGDSSEVPALRTYVPTSVIDAAYPPAPVCGDNKVNQIPNQILLLGEECDGTDDSACPGQCLPPGDLFECTCGNVPRLRLFASHELTDADAGWNGTSHEQGVSDLSGFITELSNCDCDQMTGAGCTGNSTDSECDLFGRTGPVCSWDSKGSGVRCDDRATLGPTQQGSHDGVDKDKDCWICDEFSANPGDYCRDSNDCQPQCYDANGIAVGPCTNSGGVFTCPAGQKCLGRCDEEQTCVFTPNGAPLPVSSNGAAVCSVQRFRDDIVGTRDVVTGAHEVTYHLYAIEYLGENQLRPCPVCGGFCQGGKRNLLLCQGRCSVSLTACRFDSDCPSGETCSSETPECPGGFCELRSICGADPTNPVAGQPCTIEYTHPLFGTMSNDCVPEDGDNITGQGFEIDYEPGGTSVKTLPFDNGTVGSPCTATGWELYDCPCKPQKPGQNSGEKTQPNLCAMACDAGPNFGQGCALADRVSDRGDGTRCNGGPNDGKLCDEDADCTPGTCSRNPTHCEGGDPNFDLKPCTTNADCGTDTCVDACPGGRCVPLCVEDVNESLVPGLDGVCAAGPPIKHCGGAGFEFLFCKDSAFNGTCKAVCTQDPNTSCTTQSDCPEALCSGGFCQFPVIACSSNADCPTEGPGLGCDTGSGTCIMPVNQPCGTNADCPACYGSCTKAKGCEAGLASSIIGDDNDITGAGLCIADNKNNCFLDPIVAKGETLGDPGFDPTVDDIHGVIWCYGSTQSPAINAGGGFGGPGRVIQHGVNATNGFTSLP